jgi:hypothetical protein
MTVRSKTPTIADIKWMVGPSSHFFDRATMKFFGQTMRDFRVRKSPKGNIFIFSVSGKGGHAFRQYIPSKIVGKAQLRLVGELTQPRLADIEAYIRSH